MRFLSWITYAVVNGAIMGAGYAFLDILFLFFDWIGNKSIGIAVFLYLCGGGAFLMLLFLPFYYGIPAIYKASEGVCPSRNGLRYKVLSVIIIATSLLSCIAPLFMEEISFSWQYVYNAAFAAAFMWYCKEEKKA